MRKLKEEVAGCMSGLRAEADGSLSARFTFPEDFVGFEGHFPGKKILPGVCQIDCLLSMLEGSTGKKALLKEVVMAKFILPVFPGEEISFSSKSSVEEAGRLVVKASSRKGGERASELKLRVELKER